MNTINIEPTFTETTEEHYITKLTELASAVDIKLTAEHLLAFTSIFIEKRNVLVTGGAGVGKTTFIKTVVIPMLDHLGLKYGVTATTGIAGSHLDGQTLNSWMGFGLGIGDILKDRRRSAVDLNPEELQAVYNDSLEEWYANPKMVAHRRGIMARLNNTDVLLIDEISMCGGMALFGYVDFFLRQIRGEDHKPFGGIQLILMGDFAQLPPVDKFNGTRTDWAFMCPSWRQANIKVCNLTEVFRQEDKVFAGFLNRRRVGIPMSQDEQDYVRSFVRHQTPEDVKKASYLVATNREADGRNDKALEWYPKPTEEFPILYHVPKERLKPWENEFKVQTTLVQSVSVIKETLKLRIGTPVLFTVNSPDGEFVNGTKGFVHDIKFDEGGQAGGFYDNTSIIVKIVGRGGNEKFITVQRRTYSRSKYEDPTVLGHDNRPFYPAMRQFPLIPATAITVHKSQGMSLDECSVDLSRSFAPGHVYVALSRLRTADGLTLLNSDFKVLVDPDVVDFYKRVS
jgi:ATP-dependent DNA helicase PIF1